MYELFALRSLIGCPLVSAATHALLGIGLANAKAKVTSLEQFSVYVAEKSLQGALARAVTKYEETKKSS